MKYELRWKTKESDKYKVLKEVKGHQYNIEQDKMVVFFDDKIIEIPEWKSCSLYLGMDFLLAQKDAVNKGAGKS